MRFTVFCAATLSVLILSRPAEAEPVGATLKVVNQVTAQFNRDTRSLLEGDGVNRDEVISVASDALSELVFRDETKLALGPGSQMKLDKFVYDPDKTNGSIAVNLLKGTFRFMTGVASKPTYVIKTPSASITVRGTIFDVFILNDSTTWLLLHEGAVTVSNQRGECHLHDQPGRLIRVTPDGSVGVPVNWDDLPGRKASAFDDAFPFVKSPPSVDPKPVYTRAAIMAMPSTDTDRPKSCDETKEEPRAPAPRRAQDDDDEPKVRKPVRRVQEEYVAPRKKAPKYVEKEKPEKPQYTKPKVVVDYHKPKKPHRPQETYDDDNNDGAKAAAGLLILGIAAGAMNHHHDSGGYGQGGGNSGGGYGGKPMPNSGGGYGGR